MAMLLVSQRPEAARADAPLPTSVKRTLDMGDVPCSSTDRGGTKRPRLQDVTLAVDSVYENSCFPTGTRVRGHGRTSEGAAVDVPYSMATKAGLGLPVNVAAEGTRSCLPPPSVEQELQDILEELTRNPNRSLPELDLEKILGSKGDDLLGGEGAFVHPLADGAPKPSPQGASPLESKLTQVPGFIRAPATGSPQLAPSQSGAAFSLAHSAKPVSQSQPSACHHALPGSRWHEVPHAQKRQPTPYRPDKLTSPALIPPPFSPQSSQAGLLPAAVPSPPGQQQSAPRAVGPHRRGGVRLLKAAMQVGPSAEPYSFSNTTPLRHFDPEPLICRAGHVTPAQGSSGHYGATVQEFPPPAGPAVNTAVLPLPPVQRSLDPGGARPCTRVDQNTGAAARFQEPTSLTRPPHGDSYSLLKKQLRKQLLQQEKQKHTEQMSGSRVPDCRQVGSFQGVSQSRPPGCGYSMESQPADPPVVTHNTRVPGRMALEGSHAKANHSMGIFVASLGSKQAASHPTREMGVPVQPSQAMMGLCAPPRKITQHCQPSGQPGILGQSFNGRFLQPPMPQQQPPRSSPHQGCPVPCGVLGPQQQSCLRPLWQQQQQGCPRTVSHSRVDPGSRQHSFPAGAPFSQQSLHAGMPSIPHQNGTPSLSHLPNRQARHPSCSEQHGLGPQGLMSTMAAMKPWPSLPMASLGSPSSSGKHNPGLGYSSGNSGCHLRPYEFRHPPGALAQGIGGGQRLQGDETDKVDFIDTLMGSSGSWPNNFNVIDKYLEQNT